MDFSHAFKMTTDNVPLYERGCPKDWGFLSVWWIKNPPPRRIAWHLLSKRRTTFFTAFEMTVNCHSEERKRHENPLYRRFAESGFLIAFEMTIGRNDKKIPLLSASPFTKGENIVVGLLTFVRNDKHPISLQGVLVVVCKK